MKNFLSAGVKAIASLAMLGAFLGTESSLAAQVAAPYKTIYRYDQGGRLIGTISPDPGQGAIATHKTYDPVSGLLNSTETGVLRYLPQEASTSWSWFSLTSIETYDYDEFGRKIQVTQKEGNGTVTAITQFGYDAYNRVVCKIQRMDLTNVPTALQENLCINTPLAKNSQGELDRLTVYEYNPNHQLLTETRAFRSANQQTYQKNSYGAHGLLQDTWDANNNRTHLDYYPDSDMQAQRVKDYVFPDGTYEEYTWDANGNRKSLQKRDRITTITYKYDSLNRVSTKDVSGASSDHVVYAYNNLGLQTNAATSSITLTNTFNGFGLLETEANNLTGTGLFIYDYDYNGNRLQIKHPDNQYFVYSYDMLDRLLDIKENSSAGALIQNVYDNNGHFSSQKTTANVQTTLTYGTAGDGLGTQVHSVGYSLPVDATLNLGNTFIYNLAGQITSWTNSNNNYQYTEQGSKTGIYAVNNLNEYTSINGQTIQNDLNGNLTADSDNIYGYDGENRLTSVTGASNATLSYDPNGRLYQIVANGQTTSFLYSGDALVAEYQNGTMTHRYVSGPGVDKPLLGYIGSSVSASNREFYHVNHQGSVVLATNSSGKGTYLNTYDAYGVPGVANEGRYGYTGQLWLPEIGMYYYKARIYYPGIGRFLQTDPIGYKDDMDLYTYVGDDPVNRVDPTGLADCPASYCSGPMYDGSWADAMSKNKTSTVSYTPGNGQSVGSLPAERQTELANAGLAGAASVVGGELIAAVRGASTGTTAATESIGSRAQSVHGALDDIAASRRTTAVLETRGGTRIVGSGGRDLSPAQRAVLKPGEVAARSPGAHAEATVLRQAAAMGESPSSIAVTRTICPACAELIEQTGGRLTSNTTAVW